MWLCATEHFPGQAICCGQVLGPGPCPWLMATLGPSRCTHLPIQDPIQEVQDLPKCSESLVLGQGLV